MKFLSHLPHLPDLQSAWALLLYCAVPRCNHLLRTLPPAMSQPYAEAHDQAIQATLRQFLHLDSAPTGEEADRLRRLSSLPLGLGGCGLR